MRKNYERKPEGRKSKPAEEYWGKIGSLCMKCVATPCICILSMVEMKLEALELEKKIKELKTKHENLEREKVPEPQHHTHWRDGGDAEAWSGPSMPLYHHPSQAGGSGDAEAAAQQHPHLHLNGGDEAAAEILISTTTSPPPAWWR